MMDNIRDILSSLSIHGYVVEEEVQSLAQALESTPNSIYLRNSDIGCNDLKHLGQALRYTQHTTLVLSNNNITDDGVKNLAEYLKYTQITDLDLSNNNIGCDGLKYLSLTLKDAKVTSLNLSHNNIGCSGLRYLTQVLKNTKIIFLNLNNNNIMCGSIKYLAESLRDTEIRNLDLSGNKIGFDAAQNLYKMLRNTKVSSFHIDIYCTQDGGVNHCISQRSYNDLSIIHISYRGNKIGQKGAEYINELFQSIPITQLSLEDDLVSDDVQYLAKAFKGVKICDLRIPYNHIMHGVQDLIQVFKNSRIGKLNLASAKIRTSGALSLAQFLREVKVLDLDLSLNRIGDEGLEYLVPVLKDTDIMHIHLNWNELGAEGAKYLSEILEYSKVIFVDLCHNCIGPDGAKYLADVLPSSQITGIHLHGNNIEYAGYQYLIDIVDNTNLSWVNLHSNNIEVGLKEGTKLWPYSIPRNTTPIEFEIRKAFEKLVSLDPTSNEFEFIIPENDKYPYVNVDQYGFLIRILNETPNSKVHILDSMCISSRGDNYYDFDKMDLIDEFIAEMPKKFNIFIENKLPDLIKTFGSYNYVNLVKQFEDIKQYDIVKNLLLHRVLYYVDENQEILHPYIYKMMDKYGMPLYSEQLEPNKKEEIIAFYLSHQEIEGAQEIIDFLNQQ